MARTLVKLRRQALAAQQGRCFYCESPIWEQNGKLFARRYGLPQRAARYLRCTAEHLVARQDHGSDVRQNIVAACSWCNHQRHHGGGEALDALGWRMKVRALTASVGWHPAALTTAADHHVEGS